MSTEDNEEKLEFEDLLDFGFFNPNPKDGRKVTVDTGYLARKLRDKVERYVDRHIGTGTKQDEKHHPETVILKMERKILKMFHKQVENYWNALTCRIIPMRVDIDYAVYRIEKAMWDESCRIADAVDGAASDGRGYGSKAFFQALKILLQNQRKQGE